MKVEMPVTISSLRLVSGEVGFYTAFREAPTDNLSILRYATRIKRGGGFYHEGYDQAAARYDVVENANEVSAKGVSNG